MNKTEYVERVLAVLRRTTGDEKIAIREELSAHIEDHICDLLDLGYDDALAEERTMAAMGDPEEVGRELDKQYPLHWMILGRLAVLVTIVLCINAFLGLGMLGFWYDSLEARIAPDYDKYHLEIVQKKEPLDIRVPVGNDVLRVYSIAVGEEGGERAAEVMMCAYDRMPWGIVSDDLINRVKVIAPDEDPDPYGNSGGGRGCSLARYSTKIVKLKPEDAYVRVQYSRFGETVDIEIPVPEVSGE